MAKRVTVVGGSIGGLFTAALLHRHGWEVDVYERSDVELAGRGAGIVTHEPLLEALVRCGASLDDLGVAVETRTGYGEEGEVIRQIEMPQIVTSWDRLHHLTRNRVPDERHHLDHTLASYEEHGDRVTATFTNGHSVDSDLLVGADGFRSAVRGQMQPEIRPEYAGYVVWRGVAEEADLSPEIREGVFGTFGFHLPEDGEVIGYPIAGENNVLEPGQRRYNWVWYRVVEPDTLTDMLTDASGRTHEVSIPPPLVRPDVVQRLRDDAERTLCRPFHALLSEVEGALLHADLRSRLAGDGAGAGGADGRRRVRGPSARRHGRHEGRERRLRAGRCADVERLAPRRARPLRHRTRRGEPPGLRACAPPRRVPLPALDRRARAGGMGGHAQPRDHHARHRDDELQLSPRRTDSGKASGSLAPPRNSTVVNSSSRSPMLIRSCVLRSPAA